MPGRPINVDDLWALPRVAAPPPRGGLKAAAGPLIVPVTSYDMKENRGRTRLWLVPPDARSAGAGGRRDAAIPLTAADVSSHSPRWSPDGARIVFVREPGKSGAPARHGDAGQLYVMAIDGGEAERLTDLPFGVSTPRWFPDGRRVIFLSEIYLESPDPADTAGRKQEIEDEPVKAHVTEDRYYRDWDRWVTDGRRHHVFMLDLDTRELVDLTPTFEGRFNHLDLEGSIAVAPDGREIAFAAVRSKPPHDPVLVGVFTVAVPKTGKVPRPRSLLAREYAFGQRPLYSEDGRWLLVGAGCDPYAWSEPTRLLLIDRADRSATTLAEGWDRSAAGWMFADRGRRVLVTALTEGRTGLFEIDIAHANRRRSTAPREIARGGTFGGLSVVGDDVITTESTIRRPAEVVAIPIAGGRRRTITGFTTPLMKQIDVGRVQDLTFTGARGEKVQTFLIHPPESAPGSKSKPRPLVHLVHGGPHGAFSDDWHYRWNPQMYAARGYLVAMVNFHGSVGWGHEFASCIRGSWGALPAEDIARVTDALVARRLVDPRRMALTGASYGGYLVSWIASQTDRYACIVNHAGVCDFQTQFASDFTQGWPESAGGSLWSDRAGLDRYNPIRHADGFKSPMLVLHGERDYRVPADQARTIYAVYRAMKRPARLVVYPDENHWILKPRNSRHWHEEVFGWLARWMK